MGNIKYVLKRIKSMDKKAMFDKINSIHKKTGKSSCKIYEPEKGIYMQTVPVWLWI